VTVPRRSFIRIVLLAALFFGLGTSLPLARGGELAIVKDGQAPHLVHPDPGFQILSEGGSVVLKDPKETFVVNARPGDRFTLKIRMAIDKPDKAAACLRLGHGTESSDFLFSGAHGNFIRPAGAVFFSSRKGAASEERPTPQFILDGLMFDLQLNYTRTGADTADLTVSLNGEPYVQQSGKAPKIDWIGLRPWRSTSLRIESMTLEGDFEPGGIEAKFYEPKQP